ncbi:MAG: cellulase family glycosylhydrolase [Clostridia bacterium]|nr:cellulase family glycosylhydrolase [Clostridia bacterium]
MDKISTFEKRFVDQDGRERIFNGVNVVDKSFYTPGKQNYMDIDEDIISHFAKIGISLMRLGFTWAKLEPQPGVYNDEYLDSVAEILDLCEKYNIHVFLDMHQDLYGPAEGTYGDGAPQWAMLTDGYKVKKMKFVWAEGYFWGKACHRAFDNFWKNTKYQSKGLQDYYSDCWTHVIEKIGSKPAVIGYDIMNEPFPGTDGGKCFRNIVKGAVKTILFDKEIKKGKLIKDAFSKERVPKVLGQISYSVLRKVTSRCDELIKKFDINTYTPFVNKIATAIRKAGGDGIIFLENCYYSNLGIPYSAGPIEVDGKIDQNQAFAPHAYDFTVDTPMYKYASSDRVDGIFAEHKKSQDRLGIPVTVGEWGGFGGDGDEWLPHISFLLKLFDSNKWSNTYWCYIPEFFESPLMKVFIRPYPKAIKGVIDSYCYDEEAKKFKLSFEQDEPGESIICTPFTPKKLTVDSKDTDIEVEGTELKIFTEPGKHEIEVIF